MSERKECMSREFYSNENLYSSQIEKSSDEKHQVKMLPPARKTNDTFSWFVVFTENKHIGCKTVCTCSFCNLDKFELEERGILFSFLKSHGLTLSDGHRITEDIRKKCREISETTESHYVTVPSLKSTSGSIVYKLLSGNNAVLPETEIPKFLQKSLFALHVDYQGRMIARRIIRKFLHAIQFHKNHFIVTKRGNYVKNGRIYCSCGKNEIHKVNNYFKLDFPVEK